MLKDISEPASRTIINWKLLTPIRKRRVAEMLRDRFGYLNAEPARRWASTVPRWA
jgi:hypothetical protein